MKIASTDIKRLITVRLSPGEDILLSLREAVKTEGLQNAVILEGVGSVRSHHYHVVSSPADIVNINGMVLEGRVHAHIVFANEKVAYGGHLEEGAKVLTFAVIVLAEVDADLSGYDRIGEV